jgi:hypothetical protein
MTATAGSPSRSTGEVGNVGNLCRRFVKTDPQESLGFETTRGQSSRSVDNIAYLFGAGEAEVGRSVLHTALTGRSNDELKLIVAALRDRNQPDSLVAAVPLTRGQYLYCHAQ